MPDHIILIFMSLTVAGLIIKMLALFSALDLYENEITYKKLEFLIGIQLLQTICEFAGYMAAPNFWLADYLLRFYYITTFSTMLLIPLLIFEINAIHINKLVEKACFFSIIITGYLLLFSNLIIAGTGHTGINFTRIAGPLYGMYQLFAIGSIIFCFTILLKARTKQNGLNRVKANNLTVSFSLYAGYFFSIIILMVFFKGINATGVLPVLMSIFILCIAKSLSKKQIYDLSYWIPFSKRRRLINQLIKPLITVPEDGLDVDIKKEYDNIIVKHALQLFNGNQTKAAQWLKTSQSSISRRKLS